jgi:apolipoprotein N-acyltransferase
VDGLARQTSSYLLVGAVTRRDKKDYNAAFCFTPAGLGRSVYRKQHLVPFGEFVPFKSLLSGWIRVLGDMGEFQGSSDGTMFRADEGLFSVNICFESLFPDLIRRFRRTGANLIINMTNDGWFLDTAALEQHFIASVFRAVENDVWVLHATNTGITAVIDPLGRIASRAPRGKRTLHLFEARFRQGSTFYTRHGDLAAKACAGLALFGLLLIGFVKAGRALRPAFAKFRRKK